MNNSKIIQLLDISNEIKDLHRDYINNEDVDTDDLYNMIKNNNKLKKIFTYNVLDFNQLYLFHDEYVKYVNEIFQNIKLHNGFIEKDAKLRKITMAIPTNKSITYEGDDILLCYIFASCLTYKSLKENYRTYLKNMRILKEAKVNQKIDNISYMNILNYFPLLCQDIFYHYIVRYDIEFDGYRSDKIFEKCIDYAIKHNYNDYLKKHKEGNEKLYENKLDMVIEHKNKAIIQIFMMNV